MKNKIDINKVVKRTSRDYFSGIDTKTKVIPSKTRYVRHQKHKSTKYV